MPLAYKRWPGAMVQVLSDNTNMQSNVSKITTSIVVQ